MSVGGYCQVASLADLPVGKTLCVETGGTEVLLCHTSEGVFAVDNICSHADARLCEGKLKGQKIICPLHGAAFDVSDGSALTRPAVRSIASYKVRLEEGDIFVAVVGYAGNRSQNFLYTRAEDEGALVGHNPRRPTGRVAPGESRLLTSATLTRVPSVLARLRPQVCWHRADAPGNGRAYCAVCGSCPGRT